MANKIYLSWSDFSDLIDENGIVWREQSNSTHYNLSSFEGGFDYRCDVEKGTADATDYENNYQANANKPITLGEDKVFDDEAIRDTNVHNSSISDNRGFIPKTIIIENGLDQDVSITVCGSRYSDFTVELQAGSAIDVTTDTEDYATLSDYFPYMRVKAQCSTAPTSGNLNVWLERVRA